MQPELLAPSDTFARRHISPQTTEIAEMLAALGYQSLAELADATLPTGIRLVKPLALGEPLGEHELIEELKNLAADNHVLRSFIGQGYYDTITPAVILRNVLENPGWYTQYTPYQAEISQGRLEALVNYQTMVEDLTALPLANASLLDEGTAAAEAMHMCVAASKRSVFWVQVETHPQTIAVMATRAEPLAIDLKVGTTADIATALASDGASVAGVLLSYPTTDGRIDDHRALIENIHGAGGYAVMASDLLALTLLVPPGELGADIAIGSSQRFGVPMGFGGPHAAFMAARDDFRRQMPGRIIGVSRDAKGRVAFRLALQTREQHIRRERATSNICTAQVLLAIVASMYAVYHGPEGLVQIAKRTRGFTAVTAAGLARLGYHVRPSTYFDTLRVDLDSHAQAEVLARALDRGINLRRYADGVGISCDETTSHADVHDLLEAFYAASPVALGGSGNAAPHADADLPFEVAELIDSTKVPELGPHARTSPFLTHATFQRYHAEHELLRYLNRLQAKDLSLTTSMIPLGSCTMKLNATTEMLPITWPEFARLHPFAPADQWGGYKAMFEQLEAWLAEITGLPGVSLQPNAGAQGEYAGLLAIRAYHAAKGDAHRVVCLIPQSAHGTNPASAVLAGMKVVVVASAADGTIDLGDLEAKATQHSNELGALMVTYPSTHGVFEEGIQQVCEIVHRHGGQVYLDGANLNAQLGLTRPAEIGADVCHLNLHKTFCIPHGGGGPGMGPIAVREHLAPYLPGHPLAPPGTQPVGPVSAAPWGSASILPISFAYIAMMGEPGLRQATEVAILGANYIGHRLGTHYPVLYAGRNGRVAHELILDCRPFKKSAGIEAEDIAKRLMDFGFHAPTMSFPVPGTLMVEPTESESKAEIDRFCDAMIAIRAEIAAVESGSMDRTNNPLKNAPHTAAAVTATEWDRPYSREQAAFPAPWLRIHKYWPPVARVDNAYGDRNLMCTCPPIESYG